MSDPVICVKVDPAVSDHTDVGWFFYDETWTELHGPFLSEEQAYQALDDYCYWLKHGTYLKSERNLASIAAWRQRKLRWLTHDFIGWRKYKKVRKIDLLWTVIPICILLWFILWQAGRAIYQLVRATL